MTIFTGVHDIRRVLVKKWFRELAIAGIFSLQTVLVSILMLRLCPLIHLQGPLVLVVLAVVAIGLMVVELLVVCQCRWRKVGLRVFGSMALVMMLFVYLVWNPGSQLTIPIRIMMGEGCWMWRVGEATLEVDGSCFHYDVYKYTEGIVDTSPIRGHLIFISSDLHDKTGDMRLFRKLLMTRKEMFTCCMDRIKLPFGPMPAVVRGGVQIKPRWKIDVFDEISISSVDGRRRYSCKFAENCDRTGFCEFSVKDDLFD